MKNAISSFASINNSESFSSAGFFLMLHDAHMKNQQLQHRIVDLGLEREKQSADKAREEADRATLAQSNLALDKIMAVAGFKP